MEKLPDIMPVAAISAGILNGEAILDLDYSEDSSAETDANFVMAGDGAGLKSRRLLKENRFAMKRIRLWPNMPKKASGTFFALARRITGSFRSSHSANLFLRD